MTSHLETDSFIDQDISDPFAIGTYIATADELICVQAFVDQVAGNGDYVFYATLQIGGVGSAYRFIPITTAPAASGLTAIGAQAILIPMRTNDVLTVYVDGLAGDTTTPDSIVRFFALSDLTAAQVNAEADTALMDYNAATEAELTAAEAALIAALAALNDPTAAEIAIAAFAENTGETYATAVAGSVVKEIADNAGGASLTLEDIRTQIDLALVALGLDHLISAAVLAGDVANNSIVAYLAAKGATATWADFLNTTDSLQALRDYFPTIINAQLIEEITEEGLITRTRGNTWTIQIETGIDLTGQKVQFAVKAKKADSDARSRLLVEDTTGLIYLNGADAETPTDAALVLGAGEATNSLVTITVKAVATVELAAMNGFYGLQVIDGEDVTESWGGQFVINEDVVDAVEEIGAGE